jgi:hypothetical protein
MCRIEYEIPEAGNVTVKVVDIIGSTVRVLLNDHEEAGNYYVDLNGEALVPGKYYYKIYLNTMNNGSGEYSDKNLISTGQVKL